MKAPIVSTLGSNFPLPQARFLHRGSLVRDDGPEPPKAPRLLDRVRQAIRARHYSSSTEKAYVGWIKRFIFFHGKRHPTAVGVDRHADEVISGLTARVETVVARTAALQRRPRVALLEWLDPPFSCGHWNPELVRLASGVEGLGQEGRPSRTLRWDGVLTWQPEVMSIACCGFSVERTLCDLPALQSIPGWLDAPAVRFGRVYVTNRSHYFSRPSPRLVDRLEILAHTLHPELHPLPNGVPCPVRVNGSGVGILTGVSEEAA